ncbi:MAG: thioredoxin-dependent thiol peroxidase [Bacteroidia bacterium]|nr:MAG: thioredoxin-dependent thiol peroxidase [Bacteroidia bacterium]
MEQTTELKVGDMAPSMVTLLHNGKLTQREDFAGRKVLLYFYPKDNTPGCTAEACSLRDGYQELQARGVEVIGVSPNTEKSHVGFIAKHNLPFPLIADINHELAEKYGVWKEKKMCGRTYMGIVRKSFLIDEAGRIMHIFDKVKTKEHAQQVLAVLDKAEA